MPVTGGADAHRRLAYKEGRKNRSQEMLTVQWQKVQPEQQRYPIATPLGAAGKQGSSLYAGQIQLRCSASQRSHMLRAKESSSVSNPASGLQQQPASCPWKVLKQGWKAMALLCASLPAPDLHRLSCLRAIGRPLLCVFGLTEGHLNQWSLPYHTAVNAIQLNAH